MNYGSSRLGVMVPSGDNVAETELRAMLPEDVAMMTTRLALRGSSEPELLAMLTDLDGAAAMLGHAEPDLIAFHCTAVSTFAPRLAGEIRDRIAAATGRRSIATADALLAALRALQARRVLLVTPCIEPIYQREIEFLTANGLTVSGGSWLGVNSNFGRGHRGPGPRSGVGRIGGCLLHQWQRDPVRGADCGSGGVAWDASAHQQPGSSLARAAHTWDRTARPGIWPDLRSAGLLKVRLALALQERALGATALSKHCA